MRPTLLHYWSGIRPQLSLALNPLILGCFLVFAFSFGMQNRTEVVKEYFELMVLLNQANQKSNQKTEMVFDIRTVGRRQIRYKLVALIKGSQTSFIALCDFSEKKYWAVPKDSRFFYLGSFLAYELNQKQKEYEDPIELLKP